jgi:hypothetical protein
LCLNIILLLLFLKQEKHVSGKYVFHKCQVYNIIFGFFFLLLLNFLCLNRFDKQFFSRGMLYVRIRLKNYY